VVKKENLPWRSFADPGNATQGPIAAQWNLSIFKQYNSDVDSSSWDGGAAMSAAAD